jgi:FixJ family two-component response regulator
MPESKRRAPTRTPSFPHAQFKAIFDAALDAVVIMTPDGRIETWNPQAELAEQLRVRQPQLRVLFVSGYTDDAVVRHGVLQQDVFFLQKPFNSSALLQKVRGVLDLSPSAA